MGAPMKSKVACVFQLRLPKSTHHTAVDMAKAENLSLNQFIALAVAEKITRMVLGPWAVGEDAAGERLAYCYRSDSSEAARCWFRASKRSRISTSVSVSGHP
jgi:hypothetical protein